MTRRVWLVDGKFLAKKIIEASESSSSHQLIEDGPTGECFNCHCVIDNSGIERLSLPAGTKFDPSDKELIEHLAAKCGVSNSKEHSLIDEFIPTIEGDQGINYTHPQNLPGAKQHGGNIYFFHKIQDAYSTGKRKRQKIDNQEDLVRWHRTGRIKPVMISGGCKKIMVLYVNGRKPVKDNWVMHQYHLGTEKTQQGDYVLSKIFRQQSHKDNSSSSVVETPRKEVAHDVIESSTAQRPKHSSEGQSEFQQIGSEAESVTILQCDTPPGFNLNVSKHTPEPQSEFQPHSMDWFTGSEMESAGISELEYDIPPDFTLDDLYFSSLDSIFDWK